ncbi:M64 family metallopeptidase [Paucibacter sp. APW11]|uniref:M64 family metallopeptidase n=1 Tax=Roseateles aquae TaxID=3077235 RepID=A0ABU3P5C2_9BURK|nr:M64 family metallopeptidase [Paucibacter sp. APW11]MDT8997775.1 M64 family metallopeptidase [Paucibacter sp. APW11]
MKLKLLPLPVTLAAAMLLLSPFAKADDLMLRLRLQQGPASSSYDFIHAEAGSFNGPAAVTDSRDGDLWLIGRDAAGKELFRRPLRHPGRHMAEVFNPQTGDIAVARPIQRDGVVELLLPNPPALATLDLLDSAPGGRGALAAATPLKRMSRADISALLDSSQQPRAGRQALATAVPTGSASLWNSGAANARMDLVLIGDGYTSAEQSKWQTDAQKIANGLLADPLFASYKNSFNITRVDIASPQSGVSEGGVTRNTALGTVIGCYGIDRLVCADETKVYAAVGSVTAADARDVIIVVANSTTYGGAGGNIGTMTMHPQSIEIALHEIGHTAFKLADEYDYGTCATSSEPSEANVTRSATRSGAKWASRIAASTAVPTQPGSYANGTVGLFVGAKYCTSGVYRPTENSRMRNLGQPWHQVNEARAAQVFASYTGSSGGGTGTSTTVNGTLSSVGASASYPSGSPGYYQSSAGGSFSLKLSGPATANFDLYLYKWNGSAWAVVAQAKAANSTENISYSGAAGYYYAQVKSVSGTGAFTLSYSFPK